MARQVSALKQVRKQGYVAPKATGVPAPLAAVTRYTPSGGGGYNPGPGDRSRGTDEKFRRPGVKRKVPGRRFKPKVNRFEYPYIPGGSRRRA